MMRSAIFIWTLLLLITASVQARTWRLTARETERLDMWVEKASPGDTLLLHGGVYRGPQLTIRKALTLIGQGWPVLDGESKREIMVIEAPDVSVAGLVFRNSGFSGYEDIAALRLLNCRGARVEGNRFEHTFFGIYSQHATGCVIRNNELTSNGVDETMSGNGIHAWKSDSLIIEGNRISGHRDGIYLEFVTQSRIDSNASRGNVRYGLHFMFSHDDAYHGNQFEHNGAGVAVMYSRRVTMSGNVFRQNWGDAAYGILLKDMSDSEIRDNTFEANTVGVHMEGSSRVRMERNAFVQNGWALRIQASCEDVTVARNNFLRNSFDIGTNGSLVLNSFDGNYWDRYRGYDLDRNGRGDVPYRPVSLFAMVVERNAAAMMLFRSAIATLLDRLEQVMPGLTPEALKDNEPLMKPEQLS